MPLADAHGRLQTSSNRLLLPVNSVRNTMEKLYNTDNAVFTKVV